MSPEIHEESSPAQRSLIRTFLLALPMMLLTLFLLSGGRVPSDPKALFALAAAFVFTNVLFILMIHEGKTDKYRAIFFITYSVLFVVSFISHMIEARGSMSISEERILRCEVPFCHIVIPMTLVPAALSKTIIFPGQLFGGYASIGSMFVLWIGASLALGRGFCSWACFFGGLDDGFSRVLRKPLIRKISPRWTLVPYAVLLAIVLTAAAWLTPTYCAWLCPYKAVTEFKQVTSIEVLIQTIIFVSLFIGLVIVLPILTRRRIQCGLFCPFGAFQSFTNKINAFDVRVDPEKCVKCKRCIQVCPTFSMNEESLQHAGTRITCTKCGKCVDSCPKQALSFHVKGTPLPQKPDTYRLLFLYPAFLFLATIAGGNIQDGIIRIMNLVTRGSIT
jgi:polyferredoxin